MFDFTPNNATEFLTLFSPLLPVIATYLIGRADWAKELKVGLAFAISALVAMLTAYADGTLVENFWSNFFAIFTASQGIYWTFFKALGLEKWIAPVEAVAAETADKARAQAAKITIEQAKGVLSPDDPAFIAVETKVVD